MVEHGYKNSTGALEVVEYEPCIFLLNHLQLRDVLLCVNIFDFPHLNGASYHSHTCRYWICKAGTCIIYPEGTHRVYRRHILHCFNYSEQRSICPVWNVCPVAWSKTHGCPRLTPFARTHTQHMHQHAHTSIHEVYFMLMLIFFYDKMIPLPCYSCALPMILWYPAVSVLGSEAWFKWGSNMLPVTSWSCVTQQKDILLKGKVQAIAQLIWLDNPPKKPKKIKLIQQWKLMEITTGKW